VKSTRELPPNQCFLGWRIASYSRNGLLVAGASLDERIPFLLVPPVASQKAVQDWSIPLPPGLIIRHVAQHLPEDVVAVFERRELCVACVRSLFEELTTGRS